MGRTQMTPVDAPAVASEGRAAAARTSTAARAALGRMGQRARDLGVQAQATPRDLVARRREMAADALDSLAQTMRPMEDKARRAKARRRAAAIAGGSTLALTAALGLGVALGMWLGRRRKTVSQEPAAASPPRAAGQEPPLEAPVASDVLAGSAGLG